MFLLYHSEGCNIIEMVFYWCYANDLRTTHAVVSWVTAQPTLMHGPIGDGKFHLLQSEKSVGHLA
jgi:hypothetical protein